MKYLISATIEAESAAQAVMKLAEEIDRDMDLNNHFTVEPINQ